MKDEIIIGIESSCDETAVAVLKNRTEVLANVVSSQIKTHMQFGGVMPEIASRLHLENVGYTIKAALDESKINLDDISAIAVTKGPGLIGALHVGVTAAKTMAAYLNKPLIGVHHLAGHIYANEYVSQLKFPLLAIVVSGGNSEFVYMKDHLSFEIIGSTLDDAIGESLDKIARALGLPYPGGVAIDKLSQDPNTPVIKYTKPHAPNYDLSYSGIKSALIREINEKTKNAPLTEEEIKTYAKSVEHALVDQLLDKGLKAAKDYNVKQIVLGGGVSANSYLRAEIVKRAGKDYEVIIPPLWCTTDNAAMIAKVGSYLYEKKQFMDLSEGPVASLDLSEDW